MSENQLEDLIAEDGCPKCGSGNVKSVKYTWWGGVIGPRLLKHTKCLDCNFLYNSKTRQSNIVPIIIYSVVLFAIAFAVFFMLRSNYR